MRGLTLLLIAAVPLSAAAAYERDRGPGLPAQRQGNTLVYQARDFDGVALDGAANVDVRTGSGWSVRAEGPAAAFANFRVERKGRDLIVGQRYEGRRSDPLERQITVHVTMPAVAKLSLGGSGRLLVDRVSGNALEANLGGSGNIDVNDLRVRTAEINLGGSGSVHAAGAVEQLEANLGGSGNIAAPNLRAARASVSMAGSGSVRATVAGTADVSMVGSGSVDLGPQSRCHVSKMGSGKVRCGG